MKAFLSYKHTDNQFIKDIKSACLNENHSLSFNDTSLGNPVYNFEGHVN